MASIMPPTRIDNQRMWNRLRLTRLILAVGAVFATAGCGDDRQEMAPVHGVVEFNGKPLSKFDHAAVTFTPVGGQMAKGKIDPSDGSFKLFTYSPGDGAIVGPAKVTVSATVDDASATTEDKYQGVRNVIPESFADRDASGLACEVVGGKDNEFVIHISSDGTGSMEAK
jgi:hypothetical protein